MYPMRRKTSPWALLITLLCAIQSTTVSAERIIESQSLLDCMPKDSNRTDGFVPSLFKVKFTPDTNNLALNIVGVSSIVGMISAKLQVFAYGYMAMEEDLNPCDMKLMGMCPMQEGNIDIVTNVKVSDDVISKIPGIAFSIPDLDGKVRIWIQNKQTKEDMACLEASLSNGKTVDQKAVGWISAVIAGMGLLASAITSGLGHSTTAAHVAANAMSLFGFFQAQSMAGMTAVSLPPIVAAWAQNFDWSMGLIRIRFIQKILTWYINSTGGTPAHLHENLDRVSISFMRRSLDSVNLTMGRSLHRFATRSNNENIIGEKKNMLVLAGMERVGFRSNLEITNVFMTGFSLYIAFLFLVALGVSAFKWGIETAIKMQWIRGTKFQEFRKGWLTVLKGILYRLVLIGFPQMATLCLWEWTRKDSNGALALAIFMFGIMTGVLGFGCFKVINIAKRSIMLHNTPGYILFSDPSALNRWGFLYVQYRANTYYFISVTLVYILVKAAFIGFGQKIGTVQAIALFIIELAYLIACVTKKPWMDKKTNVFNIAIAAILFFNNILLLFFTGIFNLPGIVKGVMGLVFFLVNAIFALVLLILVLVSSCYALFSKNPDVRYQPMKDELMKGANPNGSTEMDALGLAGRGDMKEGSIRRALDDDDDAFYSPPIAKQPTGFDASGVPLPPSTAGSNFNQNNDPSQFYPAASKEIGYSQYDNNVQQQRSVPTDLPFLAAGVQRVPSRGSPRSPRMPVNTNYAPSANGFENANGGYDANGNFQVSYQQPQQRSNNNYWTGGQGQGQGGQGGQQGGYY